MSTKLLLTMEDGWMVGMKILDEYIAIGMKERDILTSLLCDKLEGKLQNN